MDQPGIPISHRIVLKPNVCSVRSKRPHVENWGTGTDPQFYEGMVMGLKELGLKKFHFVEANNFHAWNFRGFVDINERHGIEMNEPERRIRNFRDGYDMTWSKVPDAVVYSRIPHYAPVNEPDTWLLNIAKWKAHGMCLTQSVKNEQGLVVLPYRPLLPRLEDGDGRAGLHEAGHSAAASSRWSTSSSSATSELNYARYDSRGDAESDAPGDLGAQDLRQHERAEDRAWP